MKISLKWIQDFVDLREEMQKPQELAELLTRAGLEVEELVDRRKDFDQVVVGLILEKAVHPNADRLSLCRVTTGEGVVHQIVCGAQNHKTGDRVVVALPGAVLPGGFAIKNSTIRGVESGGMLCSLSELGLAKESEGIVILPEDAPLGKAFADYKGLDDVFFELKVTPNRADCLSHYGLAREVSCLLGRPLREPQIKIPSGAPQDQDPCPVAVEIKESELCSRYSGRLITGVKVGPSPAWLKERLESVGLSSINNVVDVTNYVMMELGQPLHAFDAGLLKGRRISVEAAKAGEKFTSLEGKDYALKGGELLIRDGERPVALAGVMGSNNSAVSESTTEIFLESANFRGMSVRKTSRAHGLETDSAYRFARGVDSEGTRRALNRAAALIVEIAGGQWAGGIQDVNAKPFQPKSVELSLAQVSERLGYPAEQDKLVDLLVRLGCAVESPSGGQLKITPPSFRFDLEQGVDFIEEYARLNGYDKIPETLPVFAQAPTAHDEKNKLAKKAHRALRASGFYQAFNPGFVSDKGETEFLGPSRGLHASGLAVGDQKIRLKNPLSDELNVMRSSLVYGLSRNLVANVRDGNEEGGLYEIAETFHVSEGGGYSEKTRLALVKWGQSRALWTKALVVPPVFEIKAAVEDLLSQFRVTAFSWVCPQEKGEIPSFCHRGQFAQLIVEGKPVGFIATLHPQKAENDKLRVPVALAEFDFQALMRGQPRPWRAQGSSKYPAVERDLALVLPRSLKASEVLKEMKKAGGALLSEVEVFDVYEGDKMEAGKKSVAFRLTYRDAKATLQEATVQELQNQVLEALKTKFGVTVR